MRQTDIDRQADRLTDTHIDSITDRHDMHTRRQRDRQQKNTKSGSIKRQPASQTDRQTDRQTPTDSKTNR